MDSRTAALVVALLVLVAGCVGSPGGRDLEGTVDVYVGNHDQPLENFEELSLTVTAVTFVPADRANGDANTPANETTPERFEPTVNRTTVDLTTVRGDAAALVDSVALPVRERYRTVEIRVSVREATLASGAEADVTVPNGTLTLRTGFAVEPGSQMSFLVDVAAQGSNGTYTLTADGAPVTRNLTTPTAGGTTADTGATTPAGGSDETSTTGTSTPTTTTTAANGTEAGTRTTAGSQPTTSA